MSGTRRSANDIDLMKDLPKDQLEEMEMTIADSDQS
jgi:hypothetical protein